VSAVRRIEKLLIANRGEIARRIARTARAMGIATVAVYAEPDRTAPFVTEADEAVALGGSAAGRTYLDVARLVEAAGRTGADAVHPGYGFLAENAGFARAVLAAGLTWVGPAPATIAAMGDKLAAKRLMTEAGVPTLPSVDVSGLGPADLARAAAPLGYPLLVKAAAGGGGRGMRAVRSERELADGVAGARREAAGAFGDDRVFLEPCLERCRHVEVQLLGDADGHLVHAFERDCSIQRRHQKILEESPAPGLGDEARERLCAAALAAGRALGYVSAGTVEFLLDGHGRFYFLEVNTRLQVEHPVTEVITGLDLVREQLRVAQGECLGYDQRDLARTGHAIEVRLYAEDPARDFLPASGRVLVWAPPADPPARFDSGVASGTEVSTEFDPMLAKIITHAPTRGEAAARLARVLERLQVHGVTTNRDFLVNILRHEAFLAGDTTTDFIERWRPERGRVPDAAELRLAAVAAALADQDARRAAAPVLRAGPSGWRNNPSAMQAVTYRHGEHDITVDYRRERDGRFACRVGSWAGGARLGSVEGAWLDLELEGVRRRVSVTREGAERWVQTPAGETRLVEVERFPRPVREEITGGCVAPMPGRVVEVAVAVGDRVTAGQRLVVLAAMKMEHQILAAGDGLVAEMRVAVGTQVDRDEVLLVLKATGAAG
jgi:propionyl-CoA carboxylase alpha chain